MQQVTVEADLGRKLSELSGHAVICDSSGRALGIFSPLTNAPVVDEMLLEPPLSIAETEERRKVRTGKPLDEILARLGVS